MATSACDAVDQPRLILGRHGVAEEVNAAGRDYGLTDLRKADQTQSERAMPQLDGWGPGVMFSSIRAPAAEAMCPNLSGLIQRQVVGRMVGKNKIVYLSY